MLQEIERFSNFVSSKNKRKLAAKIFEKIPEAKQNLKKLRLVLEKRETKFNALEPSSLNEAEFLEEYFEELNKCLNSQIPFAKNDFIKTLEIPRQSVIPFSEEMKYLKFQEKDKLKNSVDRVCVLIRASLIVGAVHLRYESNEAIKELNISRSKYSQFCGVFKLCSVMPQFIFLISRKYNAKFYLTWSNRIAKYFETLPLEKKRIIRSVKIPDEVAKIIPRESDFNLIDWNNVPAICEITILEQGQQLQIPKRAYCTSVEHIARGRDSQKLSISNENPSVTQVSDSTPEKPELEWSFKCELTEKPKLSLREKVLLKKKLQETSKN